MRPFVGILVGLGVLAAVGCGPAPPDEERIRQAMEGMVAALEAGDVRGVLEPLADDFAGETWNLDRRALRLLLQRELRRRDRVGASLFDIDVQLLGADRASVGFQILLTGGSGYFPSDGRWFKVETGWRLDDDWALISARWEDVIGRD